MNRRIFLKSGLAAAEMAVAVQAGLLWPTQVLAAAWPSDAFFATSFDEAFAAMGELAEVLDRFFVEVLVMCDDEKTRDNRVALLTKLRREFMTLADLSRLQVDGGNQ